MAVRNRLGEANVEVVADVSGFGKGLSTKLRAALATADREAKQGGRRIGKQIVDGISEEILLRAPLLRRRINAMLRGIRVKAKVKVDLDVDTNNQSRQLKTLVGRIRGQLEGEAFGSLKSGSNFARGFLGGLIPKNLQQLSIMIALGAILGAVLAGAFNAIGRELLNVVKLSAYLPATLASIIATAVTLKVAFSGVGEAISAVFARDPEKLNEALKKLTPSARSFVLEIKKALPVFSRIKAAAQESLFAPLKGAVTNLTAALGPTVTAGLASIAASIGSLLASLANVLSSPGTQGFLMNLFATTARMITALSGPISNLVTALINAGNVALPALEKAIGGGLGTIIQRLADWINDAVASGKFQEWLDSASDTMSDLIYLTEQLMGLFGVLFDDSNEEGDSFLRIVADLIRKFAEFLASPDGQYALEGIAFAAKMAGLFLIGVISIINTMILSIGSLVNAVKGAILWIGKLVREAAKITGVSVPQTTAKWMGPTHATGDIVTKPEIAAIAESGPEVVIPLNQPGRARQLARQSGLDRMLGHSGGGITTNKFYLGEEEINARIVSTVNQQVDDNVTDATYGTRAA